MVIVNNIKKSNQQVLDTLKVERERGITILAKNTAIYYKNFKISIFSGTTFSKLEKV